MAGNIFDLRSLGGDKQLLREELPRVEEIPKYSYQWLTNEQIAAYLFFAHSNKNTIAKEVKLRPENGSLILYNKKDHSYKSDGYSWKKRKEGKVTREDHMRLKVKGVELIHANYVHSSLISTFHRRAYCLLWSTDIILVHYLNTPSVDSQLGVEEKILNNLRLCVEATSLGDEDILDQIEPMMHNCGISHAGATSFREIPNRRSWIESILNKWRNDDGSTYSRYSSSVTPVNTNPRKLMHTQSLSMKHTQDLASTTAVPIRKNNCTSDTVEQNCANIKISASVVNIDENQSLSSRPFDLKQYDDNIAIESGQFCGDDSAYCSINDCSSENNDNFDVLARSDVVRSADLSIIAQNNDTFPALSNYYDFDDLESLTFSCLPHVDGEDGDLSQLVFSRREINDLLESSKNCCPKQPPNCCQSETIQYQPDNIAIKENSSRLASISSDSRHSYIPIFSSNNNLTITDFSPNWAYSDGGEKILITGNNFKSDFQYECLFADQHIKAYCVQSGVLKCVCPPHDAESISLFVRCVDDGALSPRLTFTYKNRQSYMDQTKITQSNDNLVPKHVSQSYWLDGEERNFVRGLCERLNYLLSICNPGLELQSVENLDIFKSNVLKDCNVDSLETDLLKIFSLISPKMLKRKSTDAKTINKQFPNHYGLTFAHLAARLGYDQLLTRFVGYAENCSEFSFKYTDAFDRTPLVWSCLYNKIPAAVFLSKFSTESLLKNDRIHRKLPLSVAYERGYFDLLQKVTFEFAQRSNNFVSEKDFDTAVWILTGGLVTHNHFLAEKRSEKFESRDNSLCHSSNLFDIEMNDDAACFSNSSDSDVSIDQECSSTEAGSAYKGRRCEHSKKPVLKANSAGETDSVEIISFAQNIVEAFPRQNSPIGPYGSFANLTDDNDDNDSESLALNNFPILPNFQPPLSGCDLLSPANKSEIESIFEGRSSKFLLPLNDKVGGNVPLYSSSKTSFALSNSSSTAGFRKAGSPPARVSAIVQCSCAKMRITSPPNGNGSILSCFNEQRTPSDFDAFLNGFAPVRRVKSSLEFDFQRLSLSDREQRELYEAAKVIQNAFRQYKQRIQTRRQLEAEKHAATVIQSYYRRYKQFCYFKKVHRAAALIQKHFRTYKANKRKRSPDDDGMSASNSPCDHRPPTGAAANFSSSSCTRNISCAKRTTSISLSDCSSSGGISKNNTDFRNSLVDCTKNDHNYDKSAANSTFDNKRVVQVTADEMQIWKEQLAAIRIQHAFRGHAKRQAAARTIQRFMRRTKQRLRGTKHRANIGSSMTNTTSLRHGCQSTPSSQ